MIDDEWFDTVGKSHLSDFFGAIEGAIVLGRRRGLRPKQIDADAILRAYRGEYKVDDDILESAIKLNRDGMKQSEIARLYGVDYRSLSHRLSKDRQSAM